MKTISMITLVATVALSAPAFAATESAESKTTIERDSKGNYKEENKSQNTNANGTTNATESKSTVDVKSNGTVDQTVKTEESHDPKGLMNKTSTKTTDSKETTKNGNQTVTHKKVVNGKTVESTTETTK